MKDIKTSTWIKYAISSILITYLSIWAKNYIWLLTLPIVFDIFITKFIKNIYQRKWVKFTITAVGYSLWVIWMSSYLWLLGLPIIYDIYISKKVHWAFWKQKGVKKQKRYVEWIDAIIFAVIAASFIRMFFIEAFTIPTSSMEKTMQVGDYLFVSKYDYGPRKPMTPISFPFVHHTMPLSKTTPSFSTLLEFGYDRMPGLEKIKRNDIVVFNFPEGDTVILEHENPSYFQIVRSEALSMMRSDKQNGINNPFSYYENRVRKLIKENKNLKIAVRPVDKQENYIKRCVAIPGDKIKIVDGIMYVNDIKQKHFPQMQFKYYIYTKGERINPKNLERLGISHEDLDASFISSEKYILPLTDEMVNKIKRYSIVDSIVRKVEKGDKSEYIFPHSEKYPWSEDEFGPLTIPKKGTSINLTLDNLPIYERLIKTYEHNTLKVQDSAIFINGKKTNSYTFKMDYYWMMGDNRHMSQDSRYWGFVPEDHIVGKPLFIWLSLDKDKQFLSKIRWDRFFKKINH